MAKTKKPENILEKVEKVIESAEEKAEELVEKVKEEVKIDVKKEKEDMKELAEKEVKEKSKKLNSSEKEEKKAKLLAKAKVLAEKIEESKIDVKKEIKGKEEEEKNLLVPIEDYLKASVHLGTRVITPDMRKYVYRRRADGLAVFNTTLLDQEIRNGAEYLAKFAPDTAIIVCKREAGWKAVNKFSEVTGMRAFTKKYPAGILTNTKLENFFEVDLVFICDPWVDKNALNDARRVKVPVISICDTNNYTQGVTTIIPSNNKSGKSIGMILYLLAKLYAEKRKIKVPEFTIKDFVEDWDNLVAPK